MKQALQQTTFRNLHMRVVLFYLPRLSASTGFLWHVQEQKMPPRVRHGFGRCVCRRSCHPTRLVRLLSWPQGLVTRHLLLSRRHILLQAFFPVWGQSTSSKLLQSSVVLQLARLLAWTCESSNHVVQGSLQRKRYNARNQRTKS
ncbi:hypothetical protein BO94DRAFT_99076 [Aspergillus sclerotioniger CBS 115572]|uniref:Uncharacterized protein n=1 Tax=Aspergillus sclerotioniger CBS 115572 TaxID=1450535 RepID=A0A317WJL8_9EURO|nr:hypothetical protein BO94DRAFT_99076 [Aspergillus sclerotioniger CBS 115572]PWY85851.1 hypothetical protein BO94DRAFT_99076 [Aspergillus sclerotioniger CBS 115572]